MRGIMNDERMAMCKLHSVTRGFGYVFAIKHRFQCIKAKKLAKNDGKLVGEGRAE